MLRRTVFVLLPVALLVGTAASYCFAQNVPDAGVKGAGAIPVHEKNIGAFDINVARVNGVLTGGFGYKELSPDSTRPLHVIYSQKLTELVVVGNTATVKAVGYWNGMLSDLKIECLDDNPSGDWFHITARPRSPIPIIYDAAGGLIKGDIVVYTVQTQDGFAKGDGTIAFSQNTNVGRFRFKAEKILGVVKGYIYYAEYDPTGPAVRPKVSICVPAVARLAISGNVAVLGGKGLLNGKPAIVEVKAVDNAGWVGPIELRDEFYIRATAITPDAVSAGYEAGGPLTSGDIVVGTFVR